MTGRLLVVGASGLVGSEVMRAASSWTAHGVARTVFGPATESMDLLDVSAIERVVSRVNPEVVVVASAWPWVDGCEKEPERSFRENVQTVKNLLRVVGPSVRVAFFSTEHVFDGRAETYDENAKVNPLSVYAKHKRAVEELLLERGKSLIARTSYVFGAEERRKNFMYRVLDASENGTPLKVPTAQAGMPTWARWLAKSTLALLERGSDGVVHLVGPEVLTKAEWARLMARGLSLKSLEIVEVPWQESGQIAPRPERVRLVSSRHELQHPSLLDTLVREKNEFLSKEN